ncbi:MAG: DUF1254 domain-containing protein [Myxococcales bacterium]
MCENLQRLALRKAKARTAAPFALLAFLLSLQAFVQPTSAQKLSDDEATAIAVEAYLYTYPLVLMDLTRQTATNCETPAAAKMCAPINQFAHAPAIPDATFTDVVRPNADTLYSSAGSARRRPPSRSSVSCGHTR